MTDTTTLDDAVAKARTADALNGSSDDSTIQPDLSGVTFDTTSQQFVGTDTPQQNYVFAPIAAAPATTAPPQWSALAAAQQQADQYAAQQAQPAVTTATPALTEGESLVGPSQQAQPQQQYFLNPATGSYEPVQTAAPVVNQPPQWSPEAAALQQAGQYVGGSTVLTPQTSQDVGLFPEGGFVNPNIGVQGPEVRRAELVNTPAERAAQQQAYQYAGVGQPSPTDLQPVVRPGQLVQQPFSEGEQGVDVTPTAPAIKPGVGVPPAVQRGTLVPAPGAAPAVERAQPVPGQNYVFQPVDAQGKPVGQPVQQGQPTVARALPAGAAQPVQKAQPVDPSTFVNPNGSPYPQRIQAVGNQDPAAFIMHHTGGRGSVQSVIDTLHQRGLGVEYIMDRDGNIYDAGFGPGAQNILPGWGPKGAGLNNKNIIGMEIIAKDNNDLTPAQIQSAARFVAARYPDTPLYGHGEVNPGHKEADEGQSTSRAALALRQQIATGQAPAQVQAPAAQAQGNKGANGLYPGEDPKSFVTGPATTFATGKDRALYEQTNGEQGDSGVGAPRLGHLDTTNTIGLAVPEDVLRANLGPKPEAWRTARVDVVDPKTGVRMRVPIVDLGPGNPNATADMTPGLARFFGGEGANPNLAFKLVPNAGPDVTKNGQSFADEQAALRQGFDSSTLTAAKAAPGQNYTFKPADPAQVNDAINKGIQALPEAQSGNIVGLYKRLGGDNASPVLQSFQSNLKNEITTYAQKAYNEPDPQKAFDRAMGDANFGTVAGEAGQHFMGYMGQADLGINYLGKLGDTNRLTTFAKLLHPEANPEQIQSFVKSITTDIPDPDMRDRTIGTLFSGMEPAKQSMMNVTDVVDAADRVADPKYQQAQNQAIAQKTTWTNQQLMADPKLQGSPAERAADLGAQFGSGVMLSFLPPGIRESAFAGQIAAQTRADLKQAHPEWSEAELGRHTEDSTLLQLLPQEVLMRAVGGGLGALTRGIENPGLRMISSALAHSAVGATATTAQTVAANVVAGRPTFQGAGEAALIGAGMALPGGAIAGIHGAPPERAVTTPEQAPVPPAPEQPATRPVTRGEILGPDVPDASYPWYKPGPIITRAAERTAFTPDELAKAIDGLGQKAFSPQQLQQVIEQLQPEPDWNKQNVYLNDLVQAGEIEKARAAQEPPPPQAPAPTEPSPFPPAGAVDGSEPWVSKIANKYVAERIINNELGHVEPGQGVSTQEMVARGMGMPQDQVQQHLDDLRNNRNGGSGDQVAAVRAEEARLSQAAHQASVIAKTNPDDVQAKVNEQAAFKAVTDFHNNEVAKMKNNWHAMGMGMQGEVPVDLSTFNGLREAWLRETGQAPRADAEPAMRRMADQIAKADAEENAARKNAGAIDQYPEKGIPSEDQVKRKIMEKMGQIPCAPI